MNKSKNTSRDKNYPFYFYIIIVLIPIIFFLAIEVFLTGIDYGEEIPQWVEPSKDFPGVIMLNPYIAKKYFHNLESPPAPNYDGFYRIKKPNTFRVFVMGGSSAAGYPFPVNAAFSRYIQRYLEYKYPHSHIEVINLAMTAVNTYTLLDLLPGVIEQQPDLIIFYTGHNEYYGALGAGSVEFLGRMRFLVNFTVKIQKYKTVQLLRNVYFSLSSLLQKKSNNETSGTLMARMVGEQIIPLNSDIYYLGIRQFEGNMSDMLDILKKNNIPVIIGTLTSNLKDQPPFISIKSDSLPEANNIFEMAKLQYDSENYLQAMKLFKQAKEHDVLRFRAPDTLNKIIQKLGQKYKIQIAAIDSTFNNFSPHGIPGNNLMTDHVHPNIEGYQLMGKVFVEVMEKSKNVPDTKTQRTAEAAQHYSNTTIYLTRLDSLFSDLRIKILKNSWPFVSNKKFSVRNLEFYPRDYVDTLALKLILDEINWEEAHVKAAFWFKAKNKIPEFKREMKTLIQYAPFNDSPYKILIKEMIGLNEINETYPYLIKLHNIHPDEFSGKWLGIYFLIKGEYQLALEFLEFSAKLNKRDAQLFYNLAGAYLYNKKYEQALESVEKCLNIERNFPGAEIMKRDLQRLLGKG